jgi:hypothetical protein
MQGADELFVQGIDRSFVVAEFGSHRPVFPGFQAVDHLVLGFLDVDHRQFAKRKENINRFGMITLRHASKEQPVFAEIVTFHETDRSEIQKCNPAVTEKNDIPRVRVAME